MINVFIHGLSLTENQRTIEEIPREYSTHRLDDSISYRRKPVRTVRGGRTQILGRRVISYMYVHGPVLISYVQCNFAVFDCYTETLRLFVSKIQYAKKADRHDWDSNLLLGFRKSAGNLVFQDSP